MGYSFKDGAGQLKSMASRLDGAFHVVTHDTNPFATPDLTWLVGQPTNADTNYASVDCQRFGTVWLEFIMNGATSDAGSLFIEWSLDDVTFYPFKFDAGKFSVVDPDSKLTPTESEGKVVVAALIQETRFSLGVEKPPPFMRGRWDFTAGSATGMAGKNFGRG